MGLYDRDYVRSRPTDAGGGPGQPSGGVQPLQLRPTLNSVTFWLLVINIAVFVLDRVLSSWVRVEIDTGVGRETVPVLWGLGYFSVSTAFEQFQLWRLLTFQFLHANFGHLFANMLGLFFFGPMVEQVLGSRRYLVFYLLCGFGGVAGYMLLWASNITVMPNWVPLLGASAGIMGILIAAARSAPNLMVYLFLFIPLRLRTVAILALLYGVIIILTRGPNVGGEAGHLGGAAVGAILISFPRLLWWVQPGRKQRKIKSISMPTSADNAEVDRVLAKISQRGMHSLTEAERSLLAKASQDRSGM